MNWNRIISLSRKSLLTFLVMSTVNVLVARFYGSTDRGNLARMTLVLIVIQFLTEKGLLGSLTVHSNMLRNKVNASNNLVRRYILQRLMVVGPLLAILFIWKLHWLDILDFTLLLSSQILVTWYQANTFLLQGEDIEYWNKLFLYQAILYAVVVMPILFLELNIVLVLFAYNCSFALVGYLAKLRLLCDGSVEQGNLAAAEKSIISNYGSKNFLWITANQFLNRSDLVLFSLILSTSELGIYSVSLSLSMIVSPIFQTVGNIGFVEGSRLGSDKLSIYLKSMIRKYLRITFVAFIPVNLAGIVVYWVFLRDEYSSIVKILPFTFVFVVTKLFVQAIAQILRSSGEMSIAVRVQGFYTFSWLTFGALLASQISDFTLIVEIMAMISTVGIFVMLNYLRRRV